MYNKIARIRCYTMLSTIFYHVKVKISNLQCNLFKIQTEAVKSTIDCLMDGVTLKETTMLWWVVLLEQDSGELGAP